jgi:helicase
MSIKAITESEAPYKDLSKLLKIIHNDGPSNPASLESLSYFKEFHPETFLELEEEIVSALGLFYKNKDPDSLYSFLMSGFGEKT